MALFPPEFIVGVLVAFFQVRLRSIFSLGAWLLRHLLFFIPPEDVLIDQLNGKLTAKSKKPTNPLPPDEKMRRFYIKCVKAEHGIFAQTLFYDVYEMLMIIVTSCVIASGAGDAIALFRPAKSSMEIGAYGLVSSFLVCLWFPLQIKWTQGMATYETRLGLGIGLLGFVTAMFMLYAPKNLLDFDMEHAFAHVGSRLMLLFQSIGVQNDVQVLGPWALLGGMMVLATMAGVFTCTSFLPAFRFARMYDEMVKDAQISMVMKLLLHLNMVFPLLLCVVWVKPLATDLLVPAESLRPCSDRSLTRDCPTNFDTKPWLTESQWHAVRIYMVLVAVLIRLLCFRSHVQFFLVEPKDAIVQLVRRVGFVDGEAMKSKVRVQFNYVPVIAIQYLAPVGLLLTSGLLLARQTHTSLGVYNLIQRSVGYDIADTAAFLPDAVMPDLGGFHVGQELTKDHLGPLIKGLAQFPIVTAVFYQSFFGFFIWWCAVNWFCLSVAGLVYWKHTPHVSSAEQETAAKTQKTKQTKKHVKYKKHN